MQYNRAIFVAVIAVAVVMLVALLITDTSANESETMTSDDLQGHWYCNYIERIDTNDEYMILTDNNYPSIRNYDFDVYSVLNDEYYGVFNNEPMSGIFGEDQVTFYGSIHGTYVKFIAYHITKDVMVFASVHSEYTDDGTITGTESMLLGYTKDSPTAQANEEDWKNVYGKWSIIDDRMYNDGTVLQFGAQGLTIDMQYGCMLSGTLHNYIDGYEVLDFKGAISLKGDQYSGIGIDETGRFWTIILTDYNFVLLTTDDIGRYEYNGTTSSIRLIYSQTGLVGGESILMTLKDTKWVNLNTSSIDCYGNIITEAPLFTLEFTDQYGNMVTGTSSYGVSTTDVSVQLLNKNGLKLQIAWDDYHTTSCQNFGWIWDDVMYIVEYDDTSGTPAAKYYILEKVTDEEVAIKGHWYNTSMTTYDEKGSLITKTIIESPDIELNDFDVYGIYDGLFYGKLFGHSLSGSYVNGMLTITEIEEDYTIHMDGWFKCSTLVAVVTYMTTEDGESKQSLGTYTYRQTRSAAIIEDVPVDISGTWTLYDGFAISLDGERKEIGGTTMNITTCEHSLFKGTMQETTGSYSIIGAMIYTANNDIECVVVDSTGIWWQLHIEEDYLVMSTADSSRVMIDGKEEMNSVCRIYTKGDATPVIEQIIDMSTVDFTITSSNRIDEYGNRSSMMSDVTLAAVHQIDNNASGIMISSLFSEAPTVGFIFRYSEDLIEIRAIFQTEYMDATSYAYCWISDDTSYLVCNYSIDGIEYTTMFTMVTETSS